MVYPELTLITGLWFVVFIFNTSKYYNFQEFNSNSFCLGDRLQSSSISSYGDFTDQGPEVLRGTCTKLKEKNQWQYLMLLWKHNL